MTAIGPSRQAAFFGPTCPAQSRLTHRQPQEGTVKKGLHRPRLNAIIPILTAAGSHPDCRAVLIQIVALYSLCRALV